MKMTMKTQAEYEVTFSRPCCQPPPARAPGPLIDTSAAPDLGWGPSSALVDSTMNSRQGEVARGRVDVGAHDGMQCRSTSSSQTTFLPLKPALRTRSGPQVHIYTAIFKACRLLPPKLPPLPPGSRGKGVTLCMSSSLLFHASFLLDLGDHPLSWTSRTTWSGPDSP